MRATDVLLHGYGRGLNQDPPEVRKALLATRPRTSFKLGAPPVPWFVQDVRRVIDQAKTSECAACAVGSIADAAKGFSDPYVDVPDLYRECLRRDGTLSQPGSGTFPSTAVEVLIHRGYAYSGVT